MPTLRRFYPSPQQSGRVSVSEIEEQVAEARPGANPPGRVALEMAVVDLEPAYGRCVR